MKFLYAIGIVAVSFFITLWTMDYFTPSCPPGATVALTGPFKKWSGDFAYFAAAVPLGDRSDTSEAPKRSSYVVCENNRVLGPPHSQHAEIGTNGRGRFSHWGPGFVFSATDNSDPNANGRKYWAVQPQ
jgi:hypothetical protein